MLESVGPFLLARDNDTIVKRPTQELLKKKQTALQFSASWCSPCKKFTPLLADAQRISSNVDIVFVTSDMEEDEFLAQYKTMPWLAVPFDSPVIDDLAKEQRVSSIPRLVIVDSEGSILVSDAKNGVMSTGQLPDLN